MNKKVAIFAIVVALASCAQNGNVKIDAVESDLKANLPLGSSPEQVASFVNKRGYTSDGPLSVDELLPSMDDPNILEMPSIIRDTGRLLLVSYSITMLFKFGRDRKLRAIEVREVGTGL